MPMKPHAILSALFSIVLLASVAGADKGGNKGGGKGGPPGHSKSGGGNPSKGKSAESPGNSGKSAGQGNAGGQGQGNSGKAKARKFESNERASIERYYRDSYSGGNCPPGLAKKNNGCMPPGQARRFSAGSYLDDDIVLSPLPSGLHTHLAPPLPGYAYGYYGGNVILYETGPRLVVDVVVLF